MKEVLPYFGHDNNALSHPKCQALVASFGFAGYGRFWALNERIASTEGCCLDLSKKVNRAGLAVVLQLTLVDLEAFLKFLSDPEECGLIHYKDGQVTTDRTSENLKQLLDSREAARQRKESKKASSPNSAQSSANFGESSPNSALKERKDKVKESKEEESAESASPDPESFNTPEPQPERNPSADDFDPNPPRLNDFEPELNALKIPNSLKFTSTDLEELRARFGGRSQEAVDTISREFDAKDYGYKSHWAGVKQWLAKEPSAAAWLDKATGKAKPEAKAPLTGLQAEAARVVTGATPAQMQAMREESRKLGAELDVRDFLPSGVRRVVTA